MLANVLLSLESLQEQVLARSINMKSYAKGSLSCQAQVFFAKLFARDYVYMYIVALIELPLISIADNSSGSTTRLLD